MAWRDRRRILFVAVANFFLWHLRLFIEIMRKTVEQKSFDKKRKTPL